MHDRDDVLERAIALREAGQAEQARSLLLDLASEHVDDPEVQYQTAWVHDLLGLEAEAVPYYERSLALGIGEPDREGLVLGLGSTYRNVGRHADAVATLEMGTRDYPENDAMRCFLALALLSNGDAESALATMLTLVLDSSGSPSVERFRRALSWYRDDLLGVAGSGG
jgi:predicted Zn-dependent protease